MTDAVCSLVSVTQTQNAEGVWVETSTPRSVFCQTGPITRNEFFSAGRQGLLPELMITVASVDYAGEQSVDLGGVRYAVYRTYASGDYTELYLQRKAGEVYVSGT